jgi:hypothetical protein
MLAFFVGRCPAEVLFSAAQSCRVGECGSGMLFPRGGNSSWLGLMLWSSLLRFDSCATHAHTLLPKELASVPFGFVLARVRFRAGLRVPMWRPPRRRGHDAA